MHTLRVTTATLAVALTAAAAAWSQTAINERRPAAADAVIEVENVAGSVEVVGWGKAELEVTGTLGRGAERCEVTGDQRSLKVRVVLPKSAREVDGTTLKLQLPAGARVEVEAVSADITVSAVTGQLDLESVSGEVRLSTAGSVRVRSVSGELTIRGGGPRLDATSVSGDIEVTMDAVSDAELETVSGNVRVASAIAPRGRLEATSVSGNVDVALPAGTDASFEAESFSGSIRNGLSREAVTENVRGPGRRLEFVTGDGSGRVYLKSFSGNVEISKK